MPRPSRFAVLGISLVFFLNEVLLNKPGVDSLGNYIILIPNLKLFINKVIGSINFPSKMHHKILRDTLRTIESIHLGLQQSKKMFLDEAKAENTM